MGATKRTLDGEAKPIGPHPSIIRVSTPYSTQAHLEKRLVLAAADNHERSLAEAREDNIRLQGVAWLDNVRRSLQLPIRTYTTACVYYHKFRLAHSGGDYDWTHAAAASLLTACKVEDTLKKSRDILAAAWVLRNPQHEPLGTDDPVFEGPCRMIIGLERLVLESSGFDFRSSQSHPIIIKLCRRLPESSIRDKVSKTAWTILTDLHRTFAPLKQTSSSLAIASIQLATQLQDLAMGSEESKELSDAVQQIDLDQWSTNREEVMETLLDGLDLYTQHTTSTILGTKFSLDDFLRIRLSLNKECTDSSIARHTTAPSSPLPHGPNNVSVANGHPTPVSPPELQAQQQVMGPTVLPMPPLPETGGTLRFILNPELASDEKAKVQRYFTEEWEEYEEEIEVPVPRASSRERDRDRRDMQPPRYRDLDDRSSRGYNSPRSLDRPPPAGRGRFEDASVNRFDERDRPRARERERLSIPPESIDGDPERDLIRPRDRPPRDRRFDDRRYDDRPRARYEDRPRRYDDRRYEDRERGRYGGRYEDDRRRR
ncbi:hypothetical protein K431DRAFT_286909 [Polychaeton citri CBS 116435]|uniref:RNA polymerase II holoenzyme cyclin-like subunit n=1 Tax=Polychaeton citri CBS 116435 TaxID=1314669 RepID=A0A9P4Q2E6_9PEZI|nr:hypothetical protein K431DRAFT_286909 [Polychaeton citri CBS 116435]